MWVWTVSNTIFLFQWYTKLFTYVTLLTIFFRDISKLCDKENCKHIWCFRQINRLMFVCIIFLTTTNLDNKPSTNHITYTQQQKMDWQSTVMFLCLCYIFCLRAMLSRNTPEKILDALYSLSDFRITASVDAGLYDFIDNVYSHSNLQGLKHTLPNTLWS